MYSYFICTQVLTFVLFALHTCTTNLAGQTIIEYPTLYFGSYEHTASLQTLIVDSDNNRAENNAKAGISELAGAENADIEADPAEESFEIKTLQLPGTARKAVSFMEVSSSSVRPTAVSSSKELLGIETADSTPANTATMPSNKISSANVADLVNNMKQFIDATLSAKDDETVMEEDGADVDHGIPTPTLRALGNLGGVAGLGGLGFASGLPTTVAGTAARGVSTAKQTHNALGVKEAGELGMEEGEIDGDEEGGEENEEFLAMLKELADKDIDTLRAIIAAEEARAEEDSDDSSDDSDENA